jgi:hypothetical protein
MSSAFTFAACYEQLKALQNDPLEKIGNVTQSTLAESGWIWEGPIASLKSSFPRQNITAITYQGLGSAN